MVTDFIAICAYLHFEQISLSSLVKLSHAVATTPSDVAIGYLTPLRLA